MQALPAVLVLLLASSAAAQRPGVGAGSVAAVPVAPVTAAAAAPVAAVAPPVVAAAAPVTAAGEPMSLHAASELTLQPCSPHHDTRPHLFITPANLFCKR